jgi:hypothetical protein
VTPEALDAVESDTRAELDAMRRAETAGDLEESWPLADDAAACTRAVSSENSAPRSSPSRPIGGAPSAATIHGRTDLIF